MAGDKVEFLETRQAQIVSRIAAKHRANWRVIQRVLALQERSYSTWCAALLDADKADTKIIRISKHFLKVMKTCDIRGETLKESELGYSIPTNFNQCSLTDFLRHESSRMR